MSKVTENFDRILDTVKIDTTYMVLDGYVLRGVTFDGVDQTGTIHALTPQGIKDCVAGMLRDYCAVGSVLDTVAGKVG